MPVKRKKRERSDVDAFNELEFEAFPMGVRSAQGHFETRTLATRHLLHKRIMDHR